MAHRYQAIRGMNDILPEESGYWQQLERELRELAGQYDYREIRFPILEKTELFDRTIGQATDIVEKEMYTFDDRNGDSLSLRPEGTAGCVRAGIEQGLLYNQVQRLWYMGPMFRHERPQKGRYRQFYQFGLEAFGMAGPDIDVEQILFAKNLWERLGIQDHVSLEINSLGTQGTRQQYREQLVEYLNGHYDVLDEDSQRRLTTNPLRILDSKNPAMQEMIQAAPKLLEHLDDHAKAHFDQLLSLLDALKVPYKVNPHLVRGLDYYGLTVYEWVTDMLGAQGTVCAGGHYDVLVEQLGGKATPAVGFAMGLERLVLILRESAQCDLHPDVCLVLMGDAALAKGLALAEQLRRDVPGLKVLANLSAGGFKSQFKRADRSGAHYALILGADEVANAKISVKDLRHGEEQQSMGYAQLLDLLKRGERVW